MTLDPRHAAALDSLPKALKDTSASELSALWGIDPALARQIAAFERGDPEADDVVQVREAPERETLWVAFFLEDAEQRDGGAVAVAGGEAPSELHVTSLFVGDSKDLPASAGDKLLACTRTVAARTGPFEVELSQLGRFHTAEGKPIPWFRVAVAPHLAIFREALIEELAKVGVTADRTFATYVPHVTVKYGEGRPEEDRPKARFVFRSVRVRVGTKFTTVPLSGGR